MLGVHFDFGPNCGSSGRAWRRAWQCAAIVVTAILALVASLVTIGPARAQDLAQMPARSNVATAQDWDRSLDTVERSLHNGNLTQNQIDRFRRILLVIADQANDAAATAKSQIEAQTKLLDVLGAAPAVGQPSEAPEMARDRKELVDTLAGYRARLAQAELTSLRAETLGYSFTSLGRERFVEVMLTRASSPMLPATFTAGTSDAGAIAANWLTAPIDWVKGLADDDRGRIFGWSKAVLLIALVAMGIVARRMLLRLQQRIVDNDGPAYGRRLMIALLSAAADAVIVLAPVAGIAGIVMLTPVEVPDLARTVMVNVCALAGSVVVAVATTRAVSRREGTALHVTPLTPTAAHRLACRAFWVALVAAINQFVVAGAAASSVSPACKSVVTLLFAIVAGFTIIRVIRSDGWKRAAESKVAEQLELGVATGGAASTAPAVKVSLLPALARVVLVSAVAVGVIAALIGYTRLAHYLLANLQVTLLVGLVLIVIRVLLQEALQRLIQATRWTKPSTPVLPVEGEYDFWIRLIVDPLLVGFGAFLLAPMWGVPREEFLLWLESLTDGVPILGMTVSPIDLLLALMVFAIVLIASRALSRALDERILPRTRLDAGVRTSIAVGVGHLGAVIAGLLAISVVGINLSNLALVAGALSVGVGFGLQNIVSNFVSGLILLVERPVKVGDYVKLGDNAGFVRRINIRSTELETFERSTIIVPNSDLLSQAVTNWTHKDTVGRVDVVVGVAYGTDVDRVQELLLQCARNNPNVTDRPPPFVLFRDFGDSAYIFELRAFLFDVARQLRVGSELRIAIERSFREAGIEIPYPQRVVWSNPPDGVPTPDTSSLPAGASVPVSPVPVSPATPAAALAVSRIVASQE